MRANPLRKIFNEGGAAVNGWLALPSSFSAEVMAHQGWDSLTVDMQHGVVDYAQAVQMFTAISTTGVTPLARVPWLDAGIVMKTLDAGAYGVICPMVNNREDAEAFVSAARYPPRGRRSYGPIRALLYGGADYPKHADDTVLTIAMVETAEALDNLDAIMSVPGLDAVYIGPADLSNALGCTPKFDQDEKPVVEAIDTIAAAAKRHGIVAGIHNGTPEYARKMIGLGFQFVTIGSDARFIAAGAKAIVEAMRGVGGDGKSDGDATY